MKGKPHRAYAIGLLTAVYMMNLLDRGLMGLLLQPIKLDLGLSDTQLGFVTGIAFALFYAVAGIPVARLADRGNRVTITSLAIATWGATVMACLFVNSFVQLVCARVLAAVGEAGCKPPTYSLIGDYFPEPAERTRAMSIYWIGSPLAIMLSFIVGGWLNDIYGWRMTFFIVGIPGLLLAILVKLTLVEPRTAQWSQGRTRPKPPPLRSVIAILWSNRSTRHLTFALTLFFTMGFGMTPWSAAFLIRSHGMSVGELGFLWGVLVSAGSIVGVVAGGLISNRWLLDNERGQMRMCSITLLLSLFFYVGFLLIPQKYFAISMLVPTMAVFNCFVAPAYALLQRLVPENVRATTMALVMLFYNLIGMGLGPQIIGILSDMMAASLGTESLRYALLAMSGVILWSAWHFWLVAGSVRDDLDRTTQSRSLQNMSGDRASHFQGIGRISERRASEVS